MIIIIRAFPTSKLTLTVLEESTNTEMYSNQFWYSELIPTIDIILEKFKGQISEIMLCGPEDYTGEIGMKMSNHILSTDIQINYVSF